MGKREQLEARLIEDPSDIDARAVYADLLQSTGDPRGELILLHQRGNTADIEGHFEAHETAFLGPLARFKKTFDHHSQDAFVWHLGFIKSARLGFESNCAGDLDEDADECTADLVVAALLQHPSAMLLESLTITMNMLDDGMYFDKVMKAIAQHGAPALRTLRLGEFQHAGPGGVQNDYDYEISWSSLGDASAVWKVVPRLEDLRIQLGLGRSSSNGDADVIGTFDLPKLKRLEVVTGGMSAGCARSFAAAKLPSVESVDLWFGSHDYGGSTTAADLAPLFEGDGMPKLSHLGLMNAEIADDIVAALASSPLLARVAELDLSHGMLTDAGATTIAAQRKRFAHLTRLDLSNNYLTTSGIAAVRGVCPITEGEQRNIEDEYRYVALAE